MSHPEFSERGGQRAVDCVNRSLLIKKTVKAGEGDVFDCVENVSFSCFDGLKGFYGWTKVRNVMRCKRTTPYENSFSEDIVGKPLTPGFFSAYGASRRRVTASGATACGRCARCRHTSL